MMAYEGSKKFDEFVYQLQTIIEPLFKKLERILMKL